MKILKKILMMVLMMISILNISLIIYRYNWINSTTYWGGGLGVAEFYVGLGILALLLQIANILLIIRTLIKKKNKKAINTNIAISVIILIITYFIPIYGFPIFAPYKNLYGKDVQIIDMDF